MVLDRNMTGKSIRFYLLALVCGALAALAYCKGLGGAFIFDDKPTLITNTAVQITTLDARSLQHAAYSFNAGSGSRSLAMLTFALDYWRAGLNPTAFKVTNIVIHGLTTLVLVAFFRLLLVMTNWPQQRANITALLLALAWALHPLQVSSVLYIVQRMQTLGTLFLVLALWSYLKMRQAQLAGIRSRQFGVLTGFFWALALASKEDSALLPAYTLAMELTVLRFSAADPRLALGLRKGYLLLSLLSLAAFIFIALPHYWMGEPYRYRDFNSFERLLTQARVLVMYLWEILLPIPGHMPFYYDDLHASRGLFQPWTTFASVLLIGGLLALSWKLRTRRPLFALGVFLFFAGHGISSNIVGLELAFEHRNHFPLIGIVLAVGDLLAAAFAYFKFKQAATIVICSLIVCALGMTTAARATIWSTPLGFAKYSASLSPQSERAQGELCRAYSDLSNEDPDSPYFAQALATCSKGADIPDGASVLTSYIILKTIQGSITQSDWDRLFERLQHVTMSASNTDVVWHFVRYSHRDPRIDPRNVIRIIDIVDRRSGFTPTQYAVLGYYAAQRNLDADALRYFLRAVSTSSPNSNFYAVLVADMKTEGYMELAGKVENAISTHKPDAATNKETR